MSEKDTSRRVDNLPTAPLFVLSQTDQDLNVRVLGSWTVMTIEGAAEQFTKAVAALDYQVVNYDFTELTHLDTAGANILARSIRCDEDMCYPFHIVGGTKGNKSLMRLAANSVMVQAPRPEFVLSEILVRTGKATERIFIEIYETLAFTGQFITVLIRQIFTPRKIRWRSVVYLVEDVGLNAAPIIIMLSFFIGAVIAYMGVSLLSSFGAQIYMVDLIAIAVLREFGVLIMAIMLAGRSDSAFTAQIGSMKMRQEIDAMNVIGMDTFETLVVPRALACLISAPLLTFLAILSGVGGGILVAWVGNTGISPVLFLNRMQDVIPAKHFWIGMIKSPVFGLIIAMIGCRQGLAVTGSVESLGSRTTTSVVQAIFAVIAMDAIFAIMFFQMGV